MFNHMLFILLDRIIRWSENVFAHHCIHDIIAFVFCTSYNPSMS